jgi:SAM-dependent methyltransferase
VAEPTPRALVDAARGYETLLVPALFAEWPARVLGVADVRPGMRVLDVACGTGVLARGAAARVADSGYVAGLDPSPGMLAVARELAPDVDWHEGVAESLPFPDDSFDAVVSQFGFMFFADKARAAAEMLRVLRPAGRAAVAVWDSLENNRAYADEVELLEHMAGRRAADCVRAPFALGEPDALVAPFTAQNVAADVAAYAGRGRFPNLSSMLEADLRGWLPLNGVELTEPKIERILESAEHAMAHYVRPDGSVQFATSALIASVANPSTP